MDDLKQSESVVNIAKKISLVMKDIEYLYKDGKNDFQRYKYVSEANAVSHVRKSMIEHGIVAIPFADSESVIVAGTTKGGATQFLSTIPVIYTVIDVDSGEWVRSRIVGNGVDSGDKGPYKAHTGANKYFLFKLFQIETGDDPEIPNSSDKNDVSKLPVVNPTGIKWSLVSKYNGSCAWCLQPYNIGDKIMSSNENKVGHGPCYYKSIGVKVPQ